MPTSDYKGQEFAKRHVRRQKHGLRRGARSGKRSTDMEKEKTRIDSARARVGSGAALEALFAARPATASEPTAPRLSKIVSLPPRAADPQRLLREKLLSRLLAAEGSAAVARAAREHARAGFSFPADQDVCVKLLDHPDEDRVREAMTTLAGILAASMPRRRAVLEARLRRLEDDAEDPVTREQATALRRNLPRES